MSKPIDKNYLLTQLRNFDSQILKSKYDEAWTGTEFEYETKKTDIPVGMLVFLTDKKTINIKLIDGTLQLIADSVVIDVFSGSTSGLVPESTTEDQTKLLYGDGTWHSLTATEITNALGYVPATESVVPIFSFDISEDGNLMMHTSDSGASPVAYIAESGENKGCLMMDLG